jgi:hypothetical protein
MYSTYALVVSARTGSDSVGYVINRTDFTATPAVATRVTEVAKGRLPMDGKRPLRLMLAILEMLEATPEQPRPLSG